MPLKGEGREKIGQEAVPAQGNAAEPPAGRWRHDGRRLHGYGWGHLSERRSGDLLYLELQSM